MILSAIEAELHKDSIFNVKTYYFKGFRHDLNQITKKNDKYVNPTSKYVDPICGLIQNPHTSLTFIFWDLVLQASDFRL